MSMQYMKWDLTVTRVSVNLILMNQIKAISISLYRCEMLMD